MRETRLALAHLVASRKRQLVEKALQRLVPLTRGRDCSPVCSPVSKGLEASRVPRLAAQVERRMQILNWTLVQNLFQEDPSSSARSMDS